MIKGDTMSLLISLFQSMAYKEEIVERERQSLASISTFDPTAVFQYIDQDGDGLINSFDICSFLNSQGFHRCSEKDFSFVVNYFDSSNSEKLNYNDFMQILLPCTNDFLRNEAINRNSFHHGHHMSVDPEVIECLCSLLEKEAEYHKETEAIKQDLACSSGFNPDILFSEIDFQGYGFLDFNNIKSLLNNYGVRTSESEINSIIRRMDVTANAQISFNEFIDGIKCNSPKVGLYSEEPRFQCNNSLRNKGQIGSEYSMQKYADVRYSYQNSHISPKIDRGYQQYEDANIPPTFSNYSKANNVINEVQNKWSSDLKFPRKNDYINQSCFKEVDRYNPERNERDLSHNYKSPIYEQYPINERKISPDCYRNSYAERADYRSSPYRLNSTGGSPSRYINQNEKQIDDPVIRYDTYRNYEMNNKDEPIEPFRHKMRHEREDMTRKRYEPNFRTLDLPNDRYDQRQMYRPKNESFKEEDNMNLMRNSKNDYDMMYREVSHQPSYLESKSPYRRDNKIEPKECKKNDYPIYPGGYHNMNVSPIGNANIDYNQSNNNYSNSYMPNRYEQNPRGEERMDLRAKYRQPNNYQSSPGHRIDINPANPNDTPEKAHHNYQKHNHHGKSKHNGSKRAKSHANNRGYKREDPRLIANEINYQNPSVNNYNASPYVPGAIYNQQPNYRDQKYDRYNIPQEIHNPRDRYRNINMADNRAPHRIDLPQRTDQARYNKSNVPPSASQTPIKHEEAKSPISANPNESNQPKGRMTPTKTAEGGQKQKGAFNMLLSPEIAAKTGGWAIVASPEGKDKAVNADDSKNKATKLEGIQRGPLRL